MGLVALAVQRSAAPHRLLALPSSLTRMRCRAIIASKTVTRTS